jgi:hypothetical protein
MSEATQPKLTGWLQIFYVCKGVGIVFAATTTLVSLCGDDADILRFGMPSAVLAALCLAVCFWSRGRLRAAKATDLESNSAEVR